MSLPIKQLFVISMAYTLLSCGGNQNSASPAKQANTTKAEILPPIIACSPTEVARIQCKVAHDQIQSVFWLNDSELLITTKSGISLASAKGLTQVHKYSGYERQAMFYPNYTGAAYVAIGSTGDRMFLGWPTPGSPTCEWFIYTNGSLETITEPDVYPKWAESYLNDRDDDAHCDMLSADWIALNHYRDHAIELRNQDGSSFKSDMYLPHNAGYSFFQYGWQITKDDITNVFIPIVNSGQVSLLNTDIPSHHTDLGSEIISGENATLLTYDSINKAFCKFRLTRR